MKQMGSASAKEGHEPPADLDIKQFPERDDELRIEVPLHRASTIQKYRTLRPAQKPIAPGTHSQAKAWVRDVGAFAHGRQVRPKVSISYVVFPCQRPDP